MYTRTIKDGVPHVTYFRADDQLSFVWTGQQDDPIEVEHGGYGEPVIATIDADDVLIPRIERTNDLLASFQGACDNWASAWNGDTTPL